jgi:tetratricopeptide (TPR) repeat protein
MLEELEDKYPGHRLVADRREKLVALKAAAPSELQGPVPAQAHGEVASHSSGRRAASAPAPGQEPPDFDTHADLGIMEKTMERFQAAIEHFKVLIEDPKREVFALTMIGECCESLGDSAEAIRCYQDALKRQAVTTAEATQIYYQLGNVFHNLGDHSEALYYFERVYKRDATFRDIRRRLAAVRAESASR